MQFARAAVDAGQTVLVIDTHLEHPQIYPQNPQNPPISPYLEIQDRPPEDDRNLINPRLINPSFINPKRINSGLTHPGLINLLNSTTDPQYLMNLPNLIHTEDGLGIIPVGPIHTSRPIRLQGLLSRLDPVLQILTQQYDLVLYNAPLLSAPDTPFLLKRTDGVCLVVRLNHTAQSATYQALATVQKFELPVLGVIATRT